MSKHRQNINAYDNCADIKFKLDFNSSQKHIKNPSG